MGVDRNRRVGRWFWLSSAIVWGLCCAAGVWGLSQARDWAGETRAEPTTQGAWDEWRLEAARQANGQGPVRRRVPKSAEPPSLVLLRDHYTMCVVALVLFTGVLSITFCYLVHGAWNQPPPKSWVEEVAAFDPAPRS